MILWGIALIAIAVLALMIRSREHTSDDPSAGDRFGMTAIAILVVGGLSYDSTLVGGSRWIQVVVVVGVMAATLGRMATAGRSGISRRPVLAFVPMLLAFYMFVVSGVQAVDGSVFARLAPVVIWACFGLLLSSGAIPLKAFQNIIVGAVCCICLVMPLMATAFVACTEYKCGLFQGLLAGPFPSGNYLGQLAALSLLIGAFRFRGTLRVLVMVLNALLLVATDSRTSQVAALAGLLIGWLVTTIAVNTRQYAPARAVALLAWTAAASGMALGWYLVYHLADGDFSDRASIWGRGVGVLGSHWLTGLGGDAWSAYQSIGALPNLYPHSQALMMLFWGGLVGIIGYTIILASAVARVSGTPLLPLAAAVATFLLALGMTEAFWNPVAVDGHSFLVLFALAIAYSGPAASRPRPIERLEPEATVEPAAGSVRRVRSRTIVSSPAKDRSR